MSDRWKDLDDKYLKIQVSPIPEALETVKRLGRLKAEVGIFDKKIASYAVKHEYGAVNPNGAVIPPRPFIRPIIDNFKAQIYKIISKRLYDAFSERGGKSPPTFTKLIDVLVPPAKMIMREMVKAVWKGIPPPLASLTLQMKREKGSKYPETPLIDTGALVGSITYKTFGSNKNKTEVELRSGPVTPPFGRSMVNKAAFKLKVRHKKIKRI